ncbi:NTP transferase domain-containing protein [Planomonospora sp. ID82291]|nr:NTP transferase domain-containing protein [Planomonospora sp. ID82291]
MIPAAGQGTRLGLDVPKIMTEIADGTTVWHLLHRRLRPWTDHIHVVLSPAGHGPFQELAADEIARGAVSVSVQHTPTGMGDAIFGAAPHWRPYESILIVWGDQANLSPRTVRRVVHAHRGDDPAGAPADAPAGSPAADAARPALTLPLVPLPDPYVEYELTGPALTRVRMSREGDDCRPGGLSDVGVFCLSTGGLTAAWRDYLAGAAPGTATGEVNFLPFLPHLSRDRGWRTTVVPVTDPDEARGVNTPADLEFVRRAFLRSTR